MVEWWNALSLVQQIFYCIAIPSTVVLIIQTVLALTGLGGIHDADASGAQFDAHDGHFDTHDGHFDAHDAAAAHDAGHDHEHGMAGFRFFTVRGVFAFLVIFGWVGVALLAGETGTVLTVVISTVSGFIAMFFIALMFYGINKLQESGNLNYKNALGKTAEVYLFIPPQRKGKGKVQLELQERFIEADAVTDDEKTIRTGSQVQVCGVMAGDVLVVRRLDNKNM
jgi:hypothetical protein